MLQTVRQGVKCSERIVSVDGWYIFKRDLPSSMPLILIELFTKYGDTEIVSSLFAEKCLTTNMFTYFTRLD
jgi:hypothetical protein